MAHGMVNTYLAKLLTTFKIIGPVGSILRLWDHMYGLYSTRCVFACPWHACKMPHSHVFLLVHTASSHS